MYHTLNIPWLPLEHKYINLDIWDPSHKKRCAFTQPQVMPLFPDIMSKGSHSSHIWLRLATLLVSLGGPIPWYGTIKLQLSVLCIQKDMHLYSQTSISFPQLHTPVMLYYTNNLSLSNHLCALILICHTTIQFILLWLINVQVNIFALTCNVLRRDVSWQLFQTIYQ